MGVCGIDEIVYRVQDLPACRRFFLDWGLELVQESDAELVFHTLNHCVVRVALGSLVGLPAGLEPGPTLVEVVWGVASAADLAHYGARLADAPGFGSDRDSVGCLDPNGLSVRLRVSRKSTFLGACAKVNSWASRERIDEPSPIYACATPIEVGHVVFYVDNREAAVAFYCDRLGFAVSDSYPGRGTFLRCAPRGGHHDMFLLQLASGKKGLNHVAFTVRDIHEVFGGGLHMDRCGWKTELGPGRHPVSSAFFWYFDNPAGGLAEYYADEDELTEAWVPRDFDPAATVFAEWAVAGGIDGTTRRQKHIAAPANRFMTDKTGDVADTHS